MTSETILKKAFKKAKKNGYIVDMPNDEVRGELSMQNFIKYGIYYKFIFNHDFAKAFFVPIFTGRVMVISPDYYLDRLAEMVREKNPIKYLEQYL